ncbi:glycosyltransferase family 4 protein [Mesorhizobium sp. M0954]|uniref:glycosyltransferase family 4 protein n=1 Tax=Mesorhizobium sp. M0954 TaxID=2957032 RepID=UPI003339F440
MINLLALTRYGRLGASSRLRSFQYREPLARLGIDFDIVPLFGDDYISTIYNRTGRAQTVLKALAWRVRALFSSKAYDGLWVEKEMLPWLPAFLELALISQKLPLIVDCDDAVFHRYDTHRSSIVRAVLGRKLDRIMARADLVTAGNDYLADRAQRAGARHVEIVPTVVDLKRYSIGPRSNADMVTVGWIGSPITAPYLDIVKPILESLSQDVPLRAVAIGARPDQLAGSIFTATPWSEETEVDEIRKIDIGIMPLPDNPFERGKCGYKLIQYMALGLPVVASPVGVNKQLIRHGQNGFLAADSGQWREAIATLCNDPALRHSFGAAARVDVERHYALSVMAPRLADLIEGAVVSVNRRGS